MIYAVIDTNIFVSALLKKDSLPDMIVHHIYARNIIPVFNDEIFAEYEEVLYRQKFHFPKEAVKFTLDRVREIGIKIESVDEFDTSNFPDKKDIVFYEVWMTARKKQITYLITGNLKHFPEHDFVVTPRAIIEMN